MPTLLPRVPTLLCSLVCPKVLPMESLPRMALNLRVTKRTKVRTVMISPNNKTLSLRVALVPMGLLRIQASRTARLLGLFTAMEKVQASKSRMPRQNSAQTQVQLPVTSTL